MKPHTSITWDSQRRCWQVIVTLGRKTWQGVTYGNRSDANAMARRLQREFAEVA